MLNNHDYSGIELLLRVLDVRHAWAFGGNHILDGHLCSVGYREAAEMPQHRSLMLRRFFQDYKQLEGKAVEVDQIRPAAEAYPIISDALHRYSEQRRKGFAAHD